MTWNEYYNMQNPSFDDEFDEEIEDKINEEKYERKREDRLARESN